MLFTSFPTHPHLHIISHNSLRERITFEIGVRGRSCFPWSVNFLDFFLAACKVFRKASLSLRSWRKKSHDLQSLPSSNMLPYLVSFWLNGWNTDLGLETERHYIESFDVGVTSFWPQKVVFRSQIYSARAKLRLISDQARDLVENCFDGRPLCVPFKTARLHPGQSWITRLSQGS